MDYGAMDYGTLKQVHVACALTSASLFVLRAIGMLRSAACPRWLRIAPHGVDTLLLASALGLVFWSGQTPFNQPWLGAKIGALLLYIVLGSIALKRGKTRAVRSGALVAALATLSYLFAVALTKHPLVLL